MKNQPRAAAVYCRVSTDEQAESGTIQNQIEFARRYCDLHDLPIFGVYADDGVSGTVPLAERPEGAHLLQDARAGHFDMVLVYRVDRLARRVRQLLDAYEALQGAGVRLSSMTEPIDTQSPIGRFVFQLLGSIAELERETIIERSALGTNRVAAQGKWLGGIVPYGYFVDDEGYLQISEKPLPGLDMTEADVVRLIYRLLVAGPRPGRADQRKRRSWRRAQLGRRPRSHGAVPAAERREESEYPASEPAGPVARAVGPHNLDALTFVSVGVYIVSCACIWYIGASKGTNGEGHH